MGYPIEIAQRIPRQPAVPVPGPLARWILLWHRLRALWPRRRRATRPERFGRGVDRSLPPIRPDEVAAVDVESLVGRWLPSAGSRVDPRQDCAPR